jgi:ComF family protein
MKIIEAFLEMLYPPKCIVCGRAINSEGYCRRCENKIQPIEGETCFGCGLEKKLCRCRWYIYHFDGITAPYYNQDYAKQAIYDFKFKGLYRCVNTFADVMSDKVVETFGIENIDIVCCVPLSKEGFARRGFNQSELFAQKISKSLEKPLYSNLITKLDSVKTQHKITTVRERFLNVRGGYKVNMKIRGKNILLVDDIKTTGASLDECARQLKFAGADNVYCVTALITPPKMAANKTVDLK